MTADNGGLDSFLTTNTAANTEPNNTVSPEPANKSNEDITLEDEFAKLLNDFITQTDSSSTSKSEPQDLTPKADVNLNQNQGEVSLDNFVSEPAIKENQEGGLDGLIDTPVASQDNNGLDGFISGGSESEETQSLDSLIEAPREETDSNNLKQEEQELARAITNFQDGITAMSNKKNLKMPKTDYEESMLKPNYKPSVGKKIAQYLLECWDFINKYDPENMKLLPKDAGDEDYLSFAEGLSDTYMQLVIISYVEILINLEACEINYEQKKEEIAKNRIKRELYEEYMELQERKNAFIQKLKEKKFPIDVDRLINNYFRAAQKDPDGSFEALTKNPAMFSPIEVEKIKPKFFGLIKVTPEDGIKANQKIGNFVKKLKV